MEAMILAAGLGTRLRPLTDTIPKALIRVGGVPMLERVARRLIEIDVHRLIVNVHHHAEKIEAFVSQIDDFGIDVHISREPDRPLETGGGLKHAAALFEKREPFFLHNVDIYSDVDLGGMYDCHLASRPLATLAVKSPPSSRHLVFDEGAALCGYGDRQGSEHIVRPPQGETLRCDFCGIHVLSPRIFDLMSETGAFSIINTYLRLSRSGESVQPYHVGKAVCLDVGAPDRLAFAQSLRE